MNLGLLLTLLTGVFFLIGIFLYQMSKDKVRTSIITSACGFIVILGLIVFDLVPEVISFNKWYYYIFIILGLLLVWGIDLFVPHHHHDHHDDDYDSKDHKDHLAHIGCITIISLIFHNMIEGISLYSLTTMDIKKGLLMFIGIGLHNLPLGFQIGNFTEHKKNYLLLTLLVLSAFIGSLFVIIVGTISDLILNIILSFTLGMLLHILLFELLGEIINNIKRKETYYGIIIGVILLILINIL